MNGRAGLRNVVLLALLIEAAIVGYFVREAWIEDRTPVLAVHSCTVDTPEAVVGGVLVYTCIYDKRPGCTGTGDYTITGRPDRWGNEYPLTQPFLPRATARWDAGKNRVITQRVELPQNVPPGNYSVFWIYQFGSCVAGDGYGRRTIPFEARSPLFPIRVVRG